MVLCLQILSPVFVPEHRAGPISLRLFDSRQREKSGQRDAFLSASLNGRRPSFQSTSNMSAGDGRPKLWGGQALSQST